MVSGPRFALRCGSAAQLMLAQHYFVLTDSKLSVSEAQDEETEQPESEENPDEDNKVHLTLPQRASLTLLQNQELHFNEPWFHGKLKGGRAAAEALLKASALVAHSCTR